MTQKANEILKEALALPEAERADLAGSLLESLDAKTDAQGEEAWNGEIARRIADLDSGKAKTVSWDELQRRISAKLGR